MVTIEALVEAAKKTKSDADVELIDKAYRLSREAHEGQKRRSGVPYFDHPTEVAFILASHHLDEETIATGLLHDVVEDTLISLSVIREQFGEGIAQLVDGVTKLSSISFRSKDVRQSESFRKMLLAMAADIRVIIVKLADRLHNMRTLQHMPEMRQVAIAQETLDIYAPLANRLGMSWLKGELEDLSFKFLRPESYHRVVDQIRSSQAERDQFIARVIGVISGRMKAEKVPCEITGRFKHLYSIFKKMESRNLEFGQVHDVLAFRVMVDNISQCYEVLGHIHSMWKPVPGRFKDFIALPKTNMYQSLHTTVIGPSGERIEIQIRTREMHQIAEEGVAAHWVYKTTEGAKEQDLERFGWLRQMLEFQKELTDSHEFIETMKIDLFADEVYVFTPAGEVFEFPRGSTPIDFAYRVHTEVGHHCKGAKVNGKIVPLKYKLQNGDAIEIITDPNTRPSKDWLKIAATSRAKSKIRTVIKKEQRDAGRTVGKEVLTRELRKHGESFESLSSGGKFKSALSELGYQHLDDLLLMIGYGKVEAVEIVRRIVSPEKLKKMEPAPVTLPTKASQKKAPRDSGIKVGGMNNVLVRYGKCCDPLPGDPILGFVTRGKGVTVHKTNCYRILEIDPERKIDVEWASERKVARSVRIRVVSSDTPGILANISKTISQIGGNISHASIKTTDDRKAINMFEIDVNDTQQLYSLLRSIEKIKGVIAVERLKA
ncbi:MAG: bifunctional (p)ppGpp synthetase/guanosine-3',5'-bis(diphosphate) 3'-pyrophosphohydrolase [Pseudomonadota bacterium]